MRRGILGGTFDPIHAGHLILAQEVQWRLGLDGITFIPTGQPWMKAGEPLTAGDHRKAMVELAIAENPAFDISTVELDRPGETYTVDTLEELKAGPMADDELSFIMGVDAFNSVPRWKAPARLLELADLVVALRPGHGDVDMGALEAIVPGARDHVALVEMPLIEISGTELRRRVATGESILYLVPDPVREYIEQHKLYR